jgi:exodeoxyribonuclease VII small subunit
MAESSFEESLGQLEGLVARLEAGDLPLEAALQAFEEGVRLARLCSGRLEDAERRVHLLRVAADGTQAEVPFDPGREGDGHGER